ncbi:periplasmic protein of efflux system [Xenorhabdus vietnamensis]|uniref:Periplasmic protein of efflux system n=1 Tax=Xenorhabdus vietnamensis TaxID=351656 RepID=A0A1Y2SFL5_9GAMM|nr:macrolide transporter subunit MacA [Xenorhabdus vietnamensis]OTA16381.1 periplasmic protein of efflux system [Xenorhabdus vietnamensis]
MNRLSTKYRWTGTGLIFIAIVFVLFYFFYLPKPITYQTSAVIKKDLEKSVLAIGRLDAVSKVDVGAQVSGQLKELYVKLGDKVTQGQLLALIDPQTAKNTVSEIQETAKSLSANLRGAKAELKLAQLKVNRLNHLFKLRLTPHQELDISITDMQSKAARIDDLMAQIRQNKAKLDTAKTNLQYTRITAPIEGTVTEIKTLQGQTVIAVQQAPTILTLANLDTMIVNAEVSEADVINLKPGQKVLFTILGEPGRQFHSVLKDIQPTPQIVNNAIFYYARFEVPNPSHILRLQMTAQVKIELQSLHNVLMIPISALEISSHQYELSTQHGLSTQYEVSVLHNGKAEKRKITIGAFDNTSVQVLSGLKEHELVITNRSDNSIED